MLLNISLQTYNLSDFILYVESKYLLVTGCLGIRKLKYTADFFIYTDNNFLYFLNSSYRWYDFSSKLLFSYLSILLHSTSFGFYSKYRIKGLGHRIYIKRNNFLFKIGYSHLVYKVLPLNIVNNPKRFKKEYYFAIRGIDNCSVYNAVYTIQSYRIPNCYCFNGIFVHGTQVDPKEGKKGFML